ncbi:MAG: septum formation initiator family protein [Candidatus Latescibacterota bacterium]|nr:MAG: septum formation initiator family protein [Candidatus Latescibacterota bacterium]
MRTWGSNEPRKKRGRTPASTRAPKRSIASGGDLRQYPFLRAFYEHQTEISANLQKFLFLMVVATLLYVFVLGDAGAIKILSLKNEKARIEAEVATLNVDIKALQEEIDRLKTDPYIMEKLGREFYGYIAPGDKVFKIVRPQSEE